MTVRAFSALVRQVNNKHQRRLCLSDEDKL